MAAGVARGPRRGRRSAGRGHVGYAAAHCRLPGTATADRAGADRPTAAARRPGRAGTRSAAAPHRLCGGAVPGGARARPGGGRRAFRALDRPPPRLDRRARYALPAYQASTRVAEALTEIVVAEGPIHTDRLAFLVARGFGLSRVAETRKAAILRHLPRRLRKDLSEPVVWPPERDPEAWTGFRRTPVGVDRPVEHVPLREVVNAMVALTPEDRRGCRSRSCTGRFWGCSAGAG